MRGCGLPDEFITYVRSLANAIQPIQYYSCFISHSSKDELFAERLHADLQMNGVRCWFAPKDLKIGEVFRDRIDQSIRLHDKLLIVVSHNSISSDWVRDEVEAAMERERREDRLVLFPVQIDNAILNSEIGWVGAIRRARHVGDFSCWQNIGAYKKAFDRLLHDLKA
jgi:hypothetical protein